MKQEIFYAKIMLFGEYSVIWDSMALTIPYTRFTGELSFISDGQYTRREFAGESNRQLEEYLVYLKQLQEAGDFPVRFDLERMENDIRNGLYFESNIPQGYGIGSSGALVAAIYDQYVIRRGRSKHVFNSHEISRLKARFARMESYFHGISSGLDPLLCYIRHPLLIRDKSIIETVTIPGAGFGKNSGIFLVDTEVLGKTGPLVNLFYEKCRDERYMERVRNVFIPSNNGSIQTLLSGNMNLFFSHLSELSSFQYLYLPEMIPDHMKPVWKAGLEGDAFKMKLCGSGGGGFLLGISKDFKKTRKEFEKMNLTFIPVVINE